MRALGARRRLFRLCGRGDAGRSRGQRHIQGGRRDVRGVLYMATLTALRCNPVIRAMGDRLRQAGKVWKVVVVACMRKFLILLNTMARESLSWQQLDLVRKLQTTP